MQVRANGDENNISTNRSSNNLEVEVESFIAQITTEPLSNKTMHQLAKILSRGWEGDLIVRKIQEYIKAHSGEKNSEVKKVLDRSDIANVSIKRLENLTKEVRGEDPEKIQVPNLVGIILQLSLVRRSKESIDYTLACLAELIIKSEQPGLIAIELYQLLLERTNDKKDKAAIMIELSDCYDMQGQYVKAYNVLEKAGRIDNSETQQ